MRTNQPQHGMPENALAHVAFRRHLHVLVICTLSVVAVSARARPRYEGVVSTAAGNPEWIEQGPASITPSETYNEAGAIETILADPTNPDRIFIGSVNGGIWLTNNATNKTPLWTTNTDHAASLSIADLQFDPRDASRNTIYAAVGTYSSWSPLYGSGNDVNGGPLIGLLRSTDGGANWAAFGGTSLVGLQIRNVLPTAISDQGQVFLVATNSGIYRSNDGGISFKHLGASEGLPPGNADASSLVADPTSSLIYYTAFPGHGIYRTATAGANWTDITNNIPQNGDGGILNATRVKLSISPVSPVPIYAAIFTNHIAGLYRLSNQGTSWTSLSVPSPNLNVTYTWSAFAADPRNPNIVYAAGEFDASSPEVNNLHIGQIGSNGAMAWSSCTGSGTKDGTSHHGDSREIKFDANGDLLMGDDGGVFRLYNPSSGPTTRHWSGINGSLSITEINSVAYDTLNEVSFSGHQDTGSAQQVAEQDPSWVVVTGGDGTCQAADNGASAQTIRFASWAGKLTSLSRTTYSSANQEINGPRHVMLAAQATPGTSNSGLLPNRYYGGFALNKVTPSRMILFGPTLYEGIVKANGNGDSGDTIGTISLPDSVDGAADGIPDNLSTAVYGGWSGGKANPGVIYVGFIVNEHLQNGQLQLFQRLYGRNSDTASLVKLPFPDAYVRGVAIDPNDWHVVYALGDSHVYKSVTAGQSVGSGPSWTDITGNLPLSNLRAVDVINNGGTPASGTVVVGGAYGVFISEDGGTTPWKALGANLPNVIVNDLHYYPSTARGKETFGNVLVVGTIGRGAWTWQWNSWRANLSTGTGFQVHTMRGAWGSDGPIFAGDFDGDGKTDVMMWRNSTKSWTVNLSNGHGFDMNEWKGAWGSDGPIITGDFNGDGKTDAMMWRNSTKSWTVNLSNGHGFDMNEWKGAWGSDGPIITGDFNGDGKTDVMMWRNSTKSWTVNLSNGHGFDMNEWKGAWGSDGPIITGDFNGDGKTDVMMWRNSTKSWTVNLSNGHGFDMNEWKGAWGSDGPIITGDFNGDGKTDVMMWRNSTKSWTVNLSNGHGFDMNEWKGAWGSDGPIITGDFNGDGKTDVMMWRNSTKSWTVNLSNGHGFDMNEWKGAWGSDGPIITGDFNGDGKTDVMMWRK